MEQLNLFDVIEKNIKENTMEKFEGTLRVFEAFAGVGSQRMALRNLGIEHEVVGIAEIDKFALAAYEAIHGDCPNFGDISKIDPNTLPDMDLFTYSFPCQDLSVAGKQAGLATGTRSGLLYECQKVIEAKKPKYLLLENVKNLVGKKFKPEFDKWLEYLEGLGYKNYWEVLNAKHYGVPQNRERVFVVSILDQEGYKFPQKQELTKRIKDILEPVVDDKFYMNKPFKMVNKANVVAELGIKGHDSVRRVYDIEGEAPTLTTMEGGHREPKILEYKGQKVELPSIAAVRGRYKEDGTTEQHLEVNTSRTSNTITTVGKDNYAIEENYRVRKLTPLECWRLMGFTDTDLYKAQKVCSNSQLYKQAGNSIVVNVLVEIFRNLFL